MLKNYWSNYIPHRSVITSRWVIVKKVKFVKVGEQEDY
jgi:hypothetical protein